MLVRMPAILRRETLTRCAVNSFIFIDEQRAKIKLDK